MKKIITSMAVATLIVLFITACKKMDTQQPAQTTLQKIQAKWRLQIYYENDHYFGTDHIKNSTGGANDYLDFRADGKLYSTAFGFVDTSAYSLSGFQNPDWKQ